jgi:hypothetical protein
MYLGSVRRALNIFRYISWQVRFSRGRTGIEKINKNVKENKIGMKFCLFILGLGFKIQVLILLV